MISSIARTGAAALVLVIAALTTSFAGDGACVGRWGTTRPLPQVWDDCTNSLLDDYNNFQQTVNAPRRMWDDYWQQKRDEEAREEARRQNELRQYNERVRQANLRQLQAPLDRDYLKLEQTCANSRVGCPSSTQQKIDKWRAGRTDLPPPPPPRPPDPGPGAYPNSNPNPNPNAGPSLGPLGSQQPPGGGVGGIRLNVEVKRVGPTVDMTDLRNQVLNLRAAPPPKSGGMLDD